MNCKRCNTAVQENFRFCPMCGQNLKNKPSKLVVWSKYIAGLCVISALIWIWVVNSSDNFLEAIEGQLADLRANRITEAYFEFSSQDFQNNVPLVAFREIVKAYPALARNNGLKLAESSLKDNIAKVKALLTTADNNNTGVEYELIKENNKWKISNMLLDAPNVGAGRAAPAPSIEWLVPIDLQLRYFRSKDIESAYKDTSSKEFKAATTLEQYTQFVNKYPIFFSHNDISVKSQTIHSDEADITVVLNPGKEAVLVRYLLKLDDGKWKIWSMNITPPLSENVQALLNNPETMRKPVEAFLQALHNGDLLKAYVDYSSKAFQDTTSIDAFRKFISSYPVLTKYDAADFKEPLIDKTTGRLEIELYDKYGTTILDFTLGIEDDLWKIWGVQVVQQTGEERHAGAETKEGLENAPSPVSTPSSTPVSTPGSTPVSVPKPAQTLSVTPQEIAPENVSSFQFAKVEVGTGLNLKGEIVDPSLKLKTPHGEIYVNMYIRNGIARVKVSVYLEHVESHSTIPMVSTTLQQDGDTILSFSFSPPLQGWPKGHYLIKASSSTGIKREFSFEVE